MVKYWEASADLGDLFDMRLQNVCRQLHCSAVQGDYGHGPNVSGQHLLVVMRLSHIPGATATAAGPP